MRLAARRPFLDCSNTAASSTTTLSHSSPKLELELVSGFLNSAAAAVDLFLVLYFCVNPFFLPPPPVLPKKLRHEKGSVHSEICPNLIERERARVAAFIDIIIIIIAII